MYGELTDKETVARLEYTLENQQQDQFEILLYKKNSKLMDRWCRVDGYLQQWLKSGKKNLTKLK